MPQLAAGILIERKLASVIRPSMGLSGGFGRSGAEEYAMKANVGGIDKVLRLAAGLGLIAWALLGGPVWAWIGVVPLATGLFNFCPLYTLIGLNTCPAKK